MKKRNQNGMGTLRKRKDGRYELIQRITYADGTKKKKSFYGKSKSETIRKYKDFLKEIAVMPSSHTNITVAEYMKKYFLPMKKMQIVDKARENNKSRAFPHAKKRKSSNHIYNK